MSKKVSKEVVEEVVEASEEVKDTVAEAAEQTVEASEVTPVVVENKGFWETTAEIAAHARPIVKKIVIGVALGGLAVLAFKAVAPKTSEEEAVATESTSDDTILEGEFTTEEE